jgi:hypothetical protein
MPTLVTPVPAATGTVRVEHGNHDASARIDYEGNTHHALAIGRRNVVGQASKPSPADHEGPAAIAYERIAIGIGIDGLQDPHRNAARLCPLPSVVGHDQRIFF